MGNLCVIPARGGSKRIPRKNIRDFLGKPIISYSIKLAKQSGLFEEVMVSTDDDEIQTIAIQHGASVPFKRSIKNSDDFATTMDVLREVIDNYTKRGMNFEQVCCLYPTAPLAQLHDFKEGHRMLTEQNCQVVLPVVPFSYPIWRGLTITSSNSIRMVYPEYLNSRSQDLDKVYHDAGQWYWMLSHVIKNRISLFGEGTKVIVLDDLKVQDIDNEYDWKLAEMKYQLLNNGL
jgi:N-acylneuraminate cytidylyltransferase